MKPQSHLTEEQFARYQARTLAPQELLEVGDHIAECEECRNRLYHQEQAAGQLREWKADVSGHLEYAQIVALAEGTGAEGTGAEGSDAPELQQHLNDCAMCRGEVEDLRRFRSELNSPGRAPIPMPVRAQTASRSTRWIPALAAAVILLAAVAAWRFHQPSQVLAPQPVADANSTPSETPLSASQQQAVEAALAAHQLPRSPVLDQVLSRRGVLLGAASDQARFDVVAPVGTAVIADRPVFRWKPLTGADHYVVSVFDQNFNPVMTSPQVSATEWQPAQPLARAGIYVWQVSATLRGKTVNSPVPPAPEAKFQVVPQTVADQYDASRKEHPGDHLLLAVLCAQAGALDDAAAQLDTLAATDPVNAGALRDNLDKIRHP